MIHVCYVYSYSKYKKIGIGKLLKKKLIILTITDEIQSSNLHDLVDCNHMML